NIAGGKRDGSQWRTIGPTSREGDCLAGVRHTEPDVVADAKSRAVRSQIRIGQIKMPRGENQDLLHVTPGQVWIGREQQRGQTADLRRRKRSADDIGRKNVVAICKIIAPILGVWVEPCGPLPVCGKNADV